MKKCEINFFCDRCGGKFEVRSGETSFTIRSPYSHYGPSYRIEKVGSDDYLDLCDECKEDFIKWIAKER